MISRRNFLSKAVLIPASVIAGAYVSDAIGTSDWQLVRESPFNSKLTLGDIQSLNTIELDNGLTLQLYGIAVSFGHDLSMWRHRLSGEEYWKVEAFHGELNCHRLVASREAEQRLFDIEKPSAGKINLGSYNLMLHGLRVVIHESLNDVCPAFDAHPVKLIFDSCTFE